MPFQTLPVQFCLCVNKDCITIRGVLNCFRSYYIREKHTQIGHVYIMADYLKSVYVLQRHKDTQRHTHTHTFTHTYTHTQTHTQIIIIIIIIIIFYL